VAPSGLSEALFPGRAEWKSARERHGALYVMTCGMKKIRALHVGKLDSQDKVRLADKFCSAL
jgi:hypothetical protein